MTAVDERAVTETFEGLDVPEGMRAELLQGDIVMMAGPYWGHNMIVQSIQDQIPPKRWHRVQPQDVAVPGAFRTVMRLNPLTSIVEQSRTVIVFGGLPDFISLAIYTCCALLALAMAFWMFQRIRPGFADVL